MTIPWLTRLPTIAEVRAHSAAHPAQGPGWTTPGVWAYWLMQDGDPHLVLLRADDDGVWLADGDMLTERRYPGAKWLPCTAEGIPVCLLPDAAMDGIYVLGGDVDGCKRGERVLLKDVAPLEEGS